MLSRETGHVSPQFHVTFDTGFQTVKQLNLDSKWQQKTYFTNEKEEFAQPEKKRKSDGEVGSKTKRTRTDASVPEGVTVDDADLETIPECEQISERMAPEQVTRSG